MGNDYEYTEHKMVSKELAVGFLMMLALLLGGGLLFAVNSLYDAPETPVPVKYDNTYTSSGSATHTPSYSNKRFVGSGDKTVYFSTEHDGLVAFNAAQVTPKDDLFKSNFQAFVYRVSDGRRVFTAVNCIGDCESERTKYLPTDDYFIEVNGDDDGMWWLIVTALHE